MWSKFTAAVLTAALAAGQPCAGSDRKPYAETEDVTPGRALAPCSERLPLALRGDLLPGADVEEALEEALGAERMLGVEENVTLHKEGEVAFLRVRYPEDSINFGSADEGRPLGGASFFVPAPAGNAACIHYKVRFPEEFDFVKGGKLPGLYAGKAPSGGDKVSGSEGWSIRLMWREAGDGELYEYVYNKKGKYGASVGRGLFRFPTGQWVDVDLEVQENDRGRRNGVARLWIDGRLVIEQTDIVFVSKAATEAETGLFFSTFFGGSDSDWATPRDQHIDFGNIQLYRRGGE